MSLQSGTLICNLRQIDTSTLPADGGQRYNRLIFSSSPYLLQHAENPIDWFPWSDEAFQKAATEDRPVLISIGYSTCHWCHVMAHESFSDPEVADYLNRNFVAIKVDREERPDIDSTYMAACQMMTGSGGWPLTILATADKHPFYAATYLPKRSRQGLPGMMDLMHKVMELWRSERPKLLQTCQQVTQTLQQLETERCQPSALSEQPLYRAVDQLRQQFDERYAGFGAPPQVSRTAQPDHADAPQRALCRPETLRDGRCHLAGDP